MKKNPTDLGMNRTGMAMAPLQGGRMSENSSAPPTESGSSADLLALREPYLATPEPLGAVPLPGTLRGVMKTLVQRLSGDRAETLIDKLGERLAFERSGTRLYEIVLQKGEAQRDRLPEGILEELKRQRDEELQHFFLVKEVMEQLGADPTAMTPSADASAVTGLGLFQLASEPRATVLQSLQAILIAELVDNDGWELLIRLTEQAGLDDLTKRFEVALEEEREHLVRVRELCTRMTLGDARVGRAGKKTPEAA